MGFLRPEDSEWRPWLIYNNMPKGALFHLHCLTRGEEEQVFHIENGVQVFVSNQAEPVTL